MSRENIWRSYSPAVMEELEKVNNEYKLCLDEGKTERECIDLSVKRLEEKGYQSLEAG